MKKILLLLITAACLSPVCAQVKKGTILYDRKMNMHRMLQNEQMKAMVPEFRTSKHILFFNDTVSVYRLIPEDEAPDPFAGSGGGRVIIRTSGGDGGDLYKNFLQARSIQASELAGKNYLVTDSIRQQPWKLGTETKQILGYTCLKATRNVSIRSGGTMRMSTSGGPIMTDSSTTKPRKVEIIAWYAEGISGPAGPESYGQLPGVILELNIDNGGTIQTATEIKKTVDTKELKEPKKGKVISSEEFIKMRMDMMNQMQLPNGNIRISL